MILWKRNFFFVCFSFLLSFLLFLEGHELNARWSVTWRSKINCGNLCTGFTMSPNKDNLSLDAEIRCYNKEHTKMASTLTKNKREKCEKRATAQQKTTYVYLQEVGKTLFLSCQAFHSVHGEWMVVDEVTVGVEHHRLGKLERNKVLAELAQRSVRRGAVK